MAANNLSVRSSEILYRRGESIFSADQSWTSLEECDRICSRILWNLDTKTLLSLKKYFHLEEKSLRNENLAKKSLYASLKDFENGITHVLGDSKYSSDAAKLFQILDYDMTGTILWDQILDLLVECGDKKTKQTFEGWNPISSEKIVIIDVPHCRKEPVSQIVTIETSHHFCYAIISKYGRVGLCDGTLQLLAEYDVFFNRTGINRRVRDKWITASLYLEDCMNLIFTASDRSMMVYDASTLCHVPTFLITGLTNIPMCLAYNSSSEKSKTSRLVLGDDHGGLTTLAFQQPKTSLFHKKVHDKLNEYFWIDLQSSLHEPYCETKVLRRVHTRPVKKLVYLGHNDSIISCSSDSNVSLIIRHMKGIREPYVFKVPRGVSCFHLSEQLSLLATGGSDGRLRLWEPVTPSKALATFQSQGVPLMDVAVLAHVPAVVSFNRNGILKLWNILDQVCIQTVYLKFPSFGILGRLIQFGPQSIFCGPPRRSKLPEEVELIREKASIMNTSRSSKISADVGILKLPPSDDNEVKADSNSEEKNPSLLLDFNRWKRPEFLVTCCNHIAVVTLEDRLPDGRPSAAVAAVAESDSSSGSLLELLPPPERMHKPRKPSIWDDKQLEGGDLILIQDENDILNTEDEDESNAMMASATDLEEITLDELLENAGLSTIFEKRFVEKFDLKNDLNLKLASHREKIKKMKLPVSQGAPFTALELQDPQEIRFSVPLPLSTRMQKRSGMEFFTNPQHLLSNHSCFSMSTPRSSYSVVSESSTKLSSSFNFTT